MKYYLLTGSIDWADEFDVSFIDVLCENDLTNLKYGTEVGLFPEHYNIYFGTNEGWESDGPTLNDFKLEELSESDAAVLLKYDFPGISIIDYMTDLLYDFKYKYNIKKLSKDDLYLSMNPEEFKNIVDKYYK